MKKFRGKIRFYFQSQTSIHSFFWKFKTLVTFDFSNKDKGTG